MKKVRKFEHLALVELDDQGNVINRYENPYEYIEKNNLQGRYNASYIVMQIKHKWTTDRKRLRFACVAGDFEITSNNLPDCE